MKNSILNCSIISLLILCGFNEIKAQAVDNRVYQYGILPSNRKASDATTAYTTWKGLYAVTCTSPQYRITFSNAAQTVSEGIGYGMLISAYMGDRTLFDGLWAYYQAHSPGGTNGNGVMDWQISGCGGTASAGAATDADLDAALALVVADKKWTGYTTPAKNLIAKIKSSEIQSNVLKPGPGYGGTAETNISYYAPGYYRVFANATYGGDAGWTTIASQAYTTINGSLTTNSAKGGLVSDWCTSTGAYSSAASGYVLAGKTYSYDACRTPWRVAVDYAWFGTAAAKTYLDKTVAWVKTIPTLTKGVVDGYNQDGTPNANGQFHNAPFVGGFACAGVASDDAYLSAAYTDITTITERAYFNYTLQTLYTIFLTGNFYNPLVGPTLAVATGVKETESPALTAFVFENENTVFVSSPSSSKMDVVVMDMAGRVVHTASRSTNENIRLDNLTPGVYVVRVNADGKMSNIRFIKQ